MLLSLLACIGLQAVPEDDKPAPAGHDGHPTDSSSPLDSAGDGNSAPVADAGSDTTGLVGNIVVFDGSGSYDPDGDTLDFLWEISDAPSGSHAALVDAKEERPQLSPDVAGTYRLTLVVSDGALDSESDTVKANITEDNGTPVADAGADQTVTQGDTVTLDGTGSSDPDGDRLSYQWSLSTKPAGSTASLSSATAAKPSFTADKSGVFEATLTVNDGSSSSTADHVRIVADVDSGSGGSGGTSGCGCSDAAPGDGVLALLLFATWKIGGFKRARKA